MSTAHTHTHIHAGLLNVNKPLQAWSKLVSMEAENEWPFHWVLTNINKNHVHSVNGVLTSPATVRNKDEKGAKGKVQFQRQENGACSNSAVSHVQVQQLQSPSKGPGLSRSTLSPSYGKCPVLSHIILLNN